MSGAAPTTTFDSGERVTVHLDPDDDAATGPSGGPLSAVATSA